MEGNMKQAKNIASCRNPELIRCAVYTFSTLNLRLCISALSFIIAKGSTRRILFARAAFMALSAPCDVTMVSSKPSKYARYNSLSGNRSSHGFWRGPYSALI